MRIRSIKPEFWTSEDIAAIKDWNDRLIFIGLWSYVDDNGVGRDVEKLILADLFPLEDDPRETLASISRGLQHLFELGRITRYTVDGRQYLHVTNWDRHQRIDKPNKPRYPLPTRDDAVIRDTLARVSRDPRESPAPGAVEQGNRGTGDSAKAAHVNGAALTVVEPDAQTLVGEWIDHLPARPPSAVVGQISKQIGAMLREGIPYADVRNGLAQWQAKGLHPSALPSVVHEIRTAVPAVNKRQQQTDDMFSAAMERARTADARKAASQ